MLISRPEIWGRVVLDLEDDEFWAEVRSNVNDPIIDRPLSATCLLTQHSPRVREDGARGPGVVWPSNLDRLRAAGLLRVSVVGLETLQWNEAVSFVQAAHGRGLGTVALAGDCTEDLKALAGLPIALKLQVLFHPGYAWRAEGAGELGVVRRLELLRQLVDSGLSVRVLTSYDPAAPVTLTQLGERLDQAGIRDWRIYLREPSSGRNSGLIDAALEEVRELSRDMPWLEVKYGSFLDRELDLLIYSGGEVLARKSPGSYTLRGNIDQLANNTLLPRAFLDRHVDLWVSSKIDYEEGEASSLEDRVLDREERPHLSRHEVFLCYRRRDHVFVLSQHDRLKMAGVPVWMDEIKLEPGDHFQQKIEDAMEQSRVVVVFVGPSGLGDYQKREVAVALKLESEGALRVIPVILPGVTGESGVPPFLRTLHYVDFRRPESHPFQKLLSGIRTVIGEDKGSDSCVMDGI
ncbi:MAG TPA: toll/interleukin-1 receptor domain-containing protein [Thermoanaerobaculia bacterium]